MVEPLDVGVLSLQVAIAGTLLEGVRRRDPAAVVNAAVSLGAAFLPLALGVGLSLEFGEVGPVLSLWIGVAGFLHCLGMLGLYESVPWWDHVTHTVSAALVAALVYAGVLVGARQSPHVPPGPLTVGGATVLSTLAIGVFWELVELVARDVGESLDVEPVLVHYGWRDTALDLGFDAVGALAVVLLDVRSFVPLAEAFPGATTALLAWTTGIVVVGSALMALVALLGG
ncbi:hypothetical protein [Halorarum salinum]|uniref:Uncharacterized protein n=1 Tax=Halorarum salinum TaxID=2743089 RepID=A0A7D5Q8B2_9EURY|nr:hypothetical protein [Halobaculum salinum]QLG60837.1 hypothetical protein HUG12_03380 [Halobaculum salinum]